MGTTYSVNLKGTETELKLRNKRDKKKNVHNSVGRKKSFPTYFPGCGEGAQSRQIRQRKKYKFKFT